MEIQWPLLIFSVLLGVTSGSFVFLAVGVGGIVFAMFLPLLQVIEKMG